MNQTGVANNNLKVFFEKQYGKKLTDEEVSEYKNRLVNFFGLLIQIDKRNKRKNYETKTI